MSLDGVLCTGFRNGMSGHGPAQHNLLSVAARTVDTQGSIMWYSPGISAQTPTFPNPWEFPETEILCTECKAPDLKLCWLINNNTEEILS